MYPTSVYEQKPARFTLTARTTKKCDRMRRPLPAQYTLATATLRSPTSPLDCTALWDKLPSSPTSPTYRVPPKLQKRRAEKREWAPMAQSQHAKNTINPIRKIADSMSVACNPGKEPIRLNLGDPTVVGNLPPSAATLAAVEEALHSRRADGYGPSVGTLEARTAVAQHFGSVEHPIAVDDIVLTSGASHALDLAITAIADPGDNILVPAPGFPLYQTLCRPNGIEAREYGLRMNDGGLVDLHALEAAIDARTRAIIINNPGNPTGVVFPRAHLEAILEIASRNKVPIIADEIYGDLVYDGAVFFPMHTLSPRVPIITVDGIAKRWLVPGYRLGWLVVHDFHNVLADVLRGMIALSQKIVGPCALVQAALPKILRDTPADFFEHTKDVISRNAAAAQRVLSRVPGLKTLKPQGAMYMMVGYDPEMYNCTEMEFIRDLIAEESVYCLPGSAFNLPNWFRLVLTYPEETTQIACERIADFCQRRVGPVNFLAPPIGSTPLDDGSEGNMSAVESDE